MTARYASPTNYMLPQATGQVVGYVRDPKKFKLNNYLQLVNSPGTTGVYYELDRDRPIRVVTDAEFAWEDGDEAPSGNTNKGNFELKEFRCYRRAIPFNVGEEAQDAAKQAGAFDPVAYEAQATAAQCMTLRTKRAVAVMENTSLYPSTNYSSATSIGGGKFDAGTSTAPYLKKAILGAARVINLQTNGVVQISDLRLVLNPVDAIKISASQEIHDYLKSSRFALPNLTNTLGNPNELWGLPSHLYGVEVVVEDASYVSTRPQADADAGTRGYIKAEDSAVLCARPGSIDAPYGTKSFSTLQLFYHKYEMAVEQRKDDWNKRHEGRVIDYYAIKLTAGHSGYVFTDIIT